MLIYFAGPLFSEAERHFNQQMTEDLEAIGYQVFLPQRDGVDREQHPYDGMTKEARRRARFHLNKSKILEADVFLFILDGRVPDEGACVELGIAYCQKELKKQTKLLIGLQTDARAAFLGSKLNPMLHVPLEYITEDVETLLKMLSNYKDLGVLNMATNSRDTGL
jgi:nucleoside 2-deoxyribosyltransferase